MEDDIQNYLQTVMFRGTPCMYVTSIIIFDNLQRKDCRRWFK